MFTCKWIKQLKDRYWHKDKKICDPSICYLHDTFLWRQCFHSVALDCLKNHHLFQAMLKFMTTVLLLLSECWDHMYAPLYLVRYVYL